VTYELERSMKKITTKHPRERAVDIADSSATLQSSWNQVDQSIIVAVNGGSSGWRALEWAAAEAAALHSELHIIHVVVPPVVMLDPTGYARLAWPDRNCIEGGAQILDEAARRSRHVAPDTTVTTSLECGNLASAIRDAGHRAELIVVGRGRRRRFGLRSPSWRIVRRAIGPLAIIELNDQPKGGPSAGRVVLAFDSTAGPPPAIAYAFRAAMTRGVGLTVIHTFAPLLESLNEPHDACRISDTLRRLASIDNMLRTYQDAYPNVDVRHRFVRNTAGSALVAESEAAALMVIGVRTHGRLHHALFSSLADVAVRFAQSPTVIIRASSGGE
jgi:nucleotide-binding universal stress UspA family protein